MSPIISRLGFSRGFGSRRGFFPPTYSVSPSTSSVNEGSSVTFTVTTTNVPNGTTLYWSTNTVSGTVNASDFSDAQTTGSFTITNNSGTVTRTLSNDVTTEGSESFQLQIRTGSTSGTIVATSSTVTINDTSPLIKATGGTIVDNSGYRMHIFTSPGSFVVTDAGPGTVEYLVVAGGGGGGPSQYSSGGGGGAGGFRNDSIPITATTYPITVGAGGASLTNGNPSIFSTITSEAGGRGGLVDSPGSSGGSGGGAGGRGDFGSGGRSGGSGNVPPTTPPQGNPGAPAPSVVGGGGGGAGAGGVGGSGGVGSPITWIPASYGTPGPNPGMYFAGGGGGGPGGGSVQTGGSGGGGPSNSAGTTNTGGGGGMAAAGGSGIVVIRYLL